MSLPTWKISNFSQLVLSVISGAAGVPRSTPDSRPDLCIAALAPAGWKNCNGCSDDLQPGSLLWRDRQASRRPPILEFIFLTLLVGKYLLCTAATETSRTKIPKDTRLMKLLHNSIAQHQGSFKCLLWRVCTQFHCGPGKYTVASPASQLFQCNYRQSNIFRPSSAITSQLRSLLHSAITWH